MAEEAVMLDIFGPPPVGNLVTVCHHADGEPLTLPLGDDVSLPLTTLALLFPGACGLKFKEPGSDIWRGGMPEEGRLYPPSDAGWGSQVYVVVQCRADLLVFRRDVLRKTL